MSEHNESDELLFVDDDPDRPQSHFPQGSAELLPWKVLIADDDPEIHTITKMVLGDCSFDGRPIAFLSAYSGEETCRLMRENDDVAMILLDVVMETDTAGLDAVRSIRNDIGNRFVRIVLRTGQPGQAPERQVITDYDINDYKEKTELTSNKLFTTVAAAFRSYRDIRKIEKSRRGLERIIQASSNLFELQSLNHFVGGVLSQVASLLNPALSRCFSAGFCQ